MLKYFGRIETFIQMECMIDKVRLSKKGTWCCPKYRLFDG